MVSESDLKHVKTIPYIGNFYFTKPKRILIVGHNHYCANPDIEWTSSITIEKMSEYLQARRTKDKTQIDADLRSFLYFELAVNGEETTSEEAMLFWDSVAFYNYVQFPNTTEDKIKVMKDEQYRGSYDAFFETLRFLKPDYIIAWGITNYEKMPPQHAENLDFKNQYACIYHLDGQHDIRVLGIHHPCQGFSREKWRHTIHDFLNLSV